MATADTRPETKTITSHSFDLFCHVSNVVKHRYARRYDKSPERTPTHNTIFIRTKLANTPEYVTQQHGDAVEIISTYVHRSTNNETRVLIGIIVWD